MRIVMVHPHDLYSPLEPWTIRIKSIANQFVRKGNSVKLVYFPLDKGDANKTTTENGVDFIAFDRRLGMAIFLRNILKMIRIAEWSDVIHFQKCYYYAALPALIAAWINKKPVHYDWDDWETKIFYYSNPKQVVVGEFLNIFEKLIPKVVDTVSVSSGHLMKLCMEAGVAKENIFLAPVGADTELFQPNPNSPGEVRRRYNVNKHFILYLGQLHGGQYAELFIKSAPVVVEHRRDVSFMIVGDGYRMKELKDLALELNMQEHIIFTGSVPHSQVPNYIIDADICVACFEKNNITICKSPLKIVEYLACGKPIVASNVGEVRNMVGGVGVLTVPGDADSLANGIISLLVDTELRARLGKAARQRVDRKYNWLTTAENVLAAYRLAMITDKNKYNS